MQPSEVADAYTLVGQIAFAARYRFRSHRPEFGALADEMGLALETQLKTRDVELRRRATRALRAEIQVWYDE